VLLHRQSSDEDEEEEEDDDDADAFCSVVAYNAFSHRFFLYNEL